MDADDDDDEDDEEDEEDEEDDEEDEEEELPVTSGPTPAEALGIHHCVPMGTCA